MEIDVAAIRDNLDVIRKIVFPAGVLACVKANAYGLGASMIAPLIEKGAEMFGVAAVAEGRELRQAGIRKRILVLGLAPEEEFEDGLENGLEFAAADRKAVGRLSALARKLKKEAIVHLKVDTGMGRLGVSPENLPQFYDWCRGLEGLKVAGVFTHFPIAETRNGFTLEQIRKFREVTDPLTLPLPGGERGKKVVFLPKRAGEKRVMVMRHAANSAAVFNYPESYFDLVRVGIALYGGSLLGKPSVSSGKYLMKPVVTLGSRIVFRKEIKPGDSVGYGRTFQAKKQTGVATVSIGYADGYGRNLSNRASVLIAGKRCPVIGNICMDMMMVDVSGVERAAIGDEVILVGRQQKEEIRVEDVSGWAGTVPHEILSRLGPRLNRVYKH